MNSDVAATARAGLHHRSARHRAERFEHVGLAEVVERGAIEDRDRRPDLRLRQLGRGSRHDHVLLQSADLAATRQRSSRPAPTKNGAVV